eukprot:5517550-Amphidinium_carterae.2
MQGLVFPSFHKRADQPWAHAMHLKDLCSHAMHLKGLHGMTDDPEHNFCLASQGWWFGFDVKFCPRR